MDQTVKPRHTSEANKVALRLVQTRKALKLKPAAICRLSGINPPQWTEYEKGDRRISLRDAMRLCDTFDLTLDWIYMGKVHRLPEDFLKNLK